MIGQDLGLARLLTRLWAHLSRRRHQQFALLAGTVVVSAFAEVASLGAVVPFLGVLTAPDWIFKHPAAATFIDKLNFNSPDQLILPLTLLFGVSALVAGAIRLFLLWMSTRLAFASGADISIEVYRRTLYQPYQVHVARNSSQVISGLTHKVSGAVNVLYNSLILMSSVVLLTVVVFALFLINPGVASICVVGFGIGYGLITWGSRHSLRRNGQRIAREQTQVIKALQEGLGGIRDVLLDGTQSVYCDAYHRADRLLRRAEGNNNFIGGSPRFVMEALGMMMIAGLAYALSRQAGGLGAALPVLGALAIGAQRLLPALQQGYSSWASMIGNQQSLMDVLELLEQPLPDGELQSHVPSLQFQDSICFNDVRFRYGNDGPWVLDGLNIVVPRGVRVGIVGTTGSGKSTALDLLMGLLMPTAGEILLDGQPLSGERIKAWQKIIAHVPQSIFLADTTLAENIAFGVPRASIDFDRVRRAARQAQIADFIESGSQGYDALVGERGIRLSGGQRQRIGIARALYKQASVLVFDEATSALDGATEQTVIDAIEVLNRDLTIILIAHRLTTVRRCDTIIEIAHGKVVAEGTYADLLEHSDSFRRMAAQTVG